MEVEDDDPGIPEWVVTFGDMMSLLLTFFIMLVSMSELKKDEEVLAMLDSMRRQFGQDATIVAPIPGENQPMNSSMASMASMGRAKRQDIMRGGNKVKAVAGEDNLVRTIRPGKDTTVGGTIFFGEDSAELTEDSRARLREIAQQIAGKPQKVEIRGHTTRKPVAGGGDHWSLAYERCNNTMTYLTELGLDPRRIRLGSAGAHEPLDTSIDAESRQRNARVEVLMWDEPVRSYATDD